MKRSEMVLRITNSLFDHMFEEDIREHADPKYFIDAASDILKDMEESGMLPPPNEKLLGELVDIMLWEPEEGVI